MLDEVDCTGSESNIYDCPHNPWGQNDCKHKEDASAVCSSERIISCVYCQYTGVCDICRHSS